MKEIFLIPYSHLDTQWRWEYPTTIEKYIKNTLDENIYLFEKYPKHCFNFTGALRYSMMKEYFPESFEKVKRYVDQSRWRLAGTCLEETDVLLPSVESMIRNILYGDRWARRVLGRSSRDYMIPDCFGFPANMPTIMAHCGIHGFSSNKLTWETKVPIPFEIGVWKGPDGSEIVSALNPCRYDSHLELPVYWSPGRLGRLKRLGIKNGIWKSFQYYGVGDIGGAPKEGSVRRALASIRHFEKKGSDLRVRQGSPDEFFEGITDGEKERMDRYEGDLLLIKHSAGVLTSAAIMKRWNRKNEQMAFAAEAAATVAMLVAGVAYPSEKIESAWYRVIGNQMHDILPGTCTPTAYEFSQNDEVVALNTWASVLEDAARAVAPHAEGDGEILLFNPIGEPRKNPVDIELPWQEMDANDPVVLIDSSGRSYPAQLGENDSGTITAIFIPALPPFGWSRYTLSRVKTGKEAVVDDAVCLTILDGRYRLENASYRIDVTTDGRIDSIYHKGLGKELLKAPLAYEFQKERPLENPAWNMEWRDRKKKPFCRIVGGGEVSFIEEGPLRCTLRIAIAHNSSRFVKEISLASGSDIVEFTEKIDWRERGCSLKLAFKANMDQPEATFNWESSRINRGVNHEKCFEMPSRYWVDMSDKDWGISIIEDSKYGYDRPEDDTLRMTLLYTPAIWYLTGFWDQRFQDWGEHTIRYAIYGHKGDWRGVDCLARAFNQPVRCFVIEGTAPSGSKGNLSLFKVSNDQVGVLAVKKAEDSNDILIRLYERHGRSALADLSFITPILEAHEVNGLEERVVEVSVNGNTFTADLEANGIRSYIVRLDDMTSPRRIKQEELVLDYNCRIIGRSGEKGEALFPAELTPGRIHAGAVSYRLETEADNNALKCRGQQVTIPNGYDTFSILVGSEESCNTSFFWTDGDGQTIEEVKRHIPAMTGFLGQWDQRIWKRKPKHLQKRRRDYVWLNPCIGVKPGFINRDRMEWYSTHTHQNGADQTYCYGYLYTVELDIPQGAKSLRLPEDRRIYIMAATVSRQEWKVHSIQSLTDKYDY